MWTGSTKSRPDRNSPRSRAQPGYSIGGRGVAIAEERNPGAAGGLDIEFLITRADLSLRRGDHVEGLRLAEEAAAIVVPAEMVSVRCSVLRLLGEALLALVAIPKRPCRRSSSSSRRRVRRPIRAASGRRTRGRRRCSHRPWTRPGRNRSPRGRRNFEADHRLAAHTPTGHRTIPARPRAGTPPGAVSTMTDCQRLGGGR